ncbi:MAG: PD-(D/E)XK nuclease family transposase [Cocleimonas sp.]|nr:PD-(D/E)XK nuclease family transposase [Cocleimonas sp.]
MCMMIKDKYIDPFTDFGFKHIFGTEENKRFLISFLNDLLDIDDKIIDLEYRNLEKLGLNIIDRRAIFDVYCTDENNNNFIVELQRSKQKYFKDRSLYYTSFPIQQQSKRGDWDYRLKKIFFVGILDFTLDDDNYVTKVLLKDDNNQVFYDKLTYYYLQMPNFKKQEKELSNHLEYWLYYLNNLAQSQTIPETLANDALITEAFHVAEFLALNEDEQFAYQQDLKRRLDYKNVMDYAKEEGHKEGRKKGHEEGREEGREEAKIALAKKLLDVLDADVIAQKTGLSIAQVNKIK